MRWLAKEMLEVLEELEVLEVLEAFLLHHRQLQRPDWMEDNHLDQVVILHSMLFWGQLKDLEIITEQ